MSTANMKGRRSSHYKRRKPLPALLVFAVLAVASVFVWSKVLNATQDIDAATTCNQPGPVDAAHSTALTGAGPGQPAAPAPKPGQLMAHDALDRTDPAAAAAAKVRVLNGNGQRGQAGLVAEELTQLGFAQAGDPSNDATYPNADLNCTGQIRFGPNGAGAARTLSLIVPCAQLVRDQRQDDTVDLSLGKKFDGVKPTSDAKAALKQLDDWAQQRPAAHGGQQAQGSGPTVDNALLAKARAIECP